MASPGVSNRPDTVTKPSVASGSILGLIPGILLLAVVGYLGLVYGADHFYHL